MKGGSSGAGGIIGIIVAVIAAAALIFTGVRFPSIFTVVLWILAAVAVIAVVIIVFIIVLGNKAGSSNGEKTIKNSRGETLDADQSSVILGGREQLMEIRRMLVRLHNTAIRTSGNEVCGVIDKILQTLKDKPEKIRGMSQFLNYYLPTIKDVISHYQYLENNGVVTGEKGTGETGEKVVAFLTDTKTAMDRQYNNLFNSDKLDIAVDMEAMTINLKRDGLLDDSGFEQ